MGLFALAAGSLARADQAMAQYEQQLNQLLEQGRYGPAEETGLAMLNYALQQHGRGSQMHAAALNDLSAVYFQWGRYQDSERAALGCIEIMERNFGAQHRMLGDALNNLANSYQKEGRLRDALQVHQRGLAIRRANHGSDSPHVAMSLENMAVANVALGNYAEAESLYARALAIHVKNHGPQHRTVAVNLGNVGMLHKQQGRYTDAVDYLKRALALRSFVQDPYRVALQLEVLGRICVRLRRYEEAEAYCREARENYAAVFGVDSPLVGTLVGLGDLYLAQDRFADAEKIYQQALASNRELFGENSVDVAEGLIDLGRLAMARHQAAAAEDYFNRALAIVSQLEGNPDQVAELHFFRGIAAWNAGHRDQARSDFEAGMQLTDNERAGITGGEYERAEAFGSLQDRYIVPAQYYFEEHEFAAGLQALERGRNRSLLEQMATAHVDLLAGLPPAQRQSLEAAERTAQAQIASLERQLEVLAERGDLDEAQRQVELERLRKALASARREAVEVYAAIRTASPKFRAAVGQSIEPVDLATLQQWLGEQDALLLYYSVSRYGLRVLTVAGPGEAPRDALIAADSDQAAKLGVPAGPLAQFYAYAMLTNEAGDGVLQLLSHPDKATSAADKLAALWTLLVPEHAREGLLKGAFKRLVIIPDGPLAMLPFEALITKPGSAPEYLLDSGPPINYAPSATIVLNLARRAADDASGREPVLAIGDPAYPSATDDSTAASRYGGWGGKLSRLPFSGQEATWVTEVYKREGIKAAILKGKLASEAMVRGNVKGRRVVHLACHGLADPMYGNFFGALALTPVSATADDDGFLSLAEIYQLDARSCELAILSACQTNYGQHQQGEGVWSISRGFVVAGARRVVASNWLVDDQAAASLISYYCAQLAQQEHEGKTPDYAGALQAAKRWVRHQAKWQSPFFWSTFVLIGPG